MGIYDKYVAILKHSHIIKNCFVSFQTTYTKQSSIPPTGAPRFLCLFLLIIKVGAVVGAMEM